jgi:hypothetical protein
VSNLGKASRMGRPRSPKMAEHKATLLRRVAEGETVSAVCEDLGIERSTPWRWAQDDAEFRNAYARARENQAHALAEQAIMIATGNDAMTVAWERGIEAAAEELEKSGNQKWRQVVNALENNLVQRNRLRVDTLKWFTSKIAPKLYGERIQAEVTGADGGPVQQAMTITFRHATQ